MPLKINFAALKSTLQTALANPEIKSGEKGHLRRLDSELLIFEAKSRDTIQAEVDLENSKQYGHSLYQSLYKQYMALNEVMGELTHNIDHIIAANKKIEDFSERATLPYRDALMECRFILVEYQILINAHLKNKKGYLDPETPVQPHFQLCNLLGGQYYILAQADDPFLGGYHTQGITKLSNGFCGGEVIEWCKQFIKQDCPVYPIVGNHSIQAQQDDQLKICLAEMNKLKELDVAKIDLYSMLKSLTHTKVYYIVIADDDKSHAIGIRKFKNGHYHFFEPNLGGIFLADRGRMAAFLSYHFATLRETDFCIDRAIIYEFKQDVAKPDAESTPNDQTLAELDRAMDFTKRSDEIYKIVYEQLSDLYKSADESLADRTKKLTAMQLLLVNHFQYSRSSRVVELARDVFRYLETGTIDIEKRDSNVLLLKLDIWKVRELIPASIQFGQEQGRALRAKILNRPRRDRKLQAQYDYLVKILAQISYYIESQMERIDEELKEKIISIERRARFNLKKSILNSLLASVNSPNYFGVVQFIAASLPSHNDVNDYQTCLNIAATIFPRVLTQPLVLSDSHSHVDEYVARMMTSKAIHHIHLLQRFSFAVQGWMALRAPRTTPVEWVDRLEHIAFTGLLDKLPLLNHEINELLEKTNVSFIFEAPSYNLTKTISLTWNDIGTIVKENAHRFAEILKIAYPFADALLDSIVAQRLAKFNDLLHIELPEKIAESKAKANNNLCALAKNYLVKLQHKFDVICLRAMSEKEYAVAEELHSLEQEVAIIFKSNDILANLREPQKLIAIMQKAIDELHVYLKPILQDQKKFVHCPPSTIQNFVLHKVLREYYSVRVSRMNDLLKSTEVQLRQFTNLERSESDVHEFMSRQFKKTGDGQYDIDATLALAFEERATMNKKIDEAMAYATTTLQLEIKRMDKVMFAQSDQLPFNYTMLALSKAEISFLYNQHVLRNYKEYLREIGDPNQADGVSTLLKIPSSLIYDASISAEFTALHAAQAKAGLDAFVKLSNEVGQLRLRKLRTVLNKLFDEVTDIKKQKHHESLDNAQAFLSANIAQLNKKSSLTEDDLIQMQKKLNQHLNAELFTKQQSLKDTLRDCIIAGLRAQGMPILRRMPRFTLAEMPLRIGSNSPPPEQKSTMNDKSTLANFG